MKTTNRIFARDTLRWGYSLFPQFVNHQLLIQDGNFSSDKDISNIFSDACFTCISFNTDCSKKVSPDGNNT